MVKETHQSPENTLLTDNLCLVQAVAWRSFPALARDEDLLQCGRIALWQAVQHWDHRRPFRPFACACIHNAMGRWAGRIRHWSAQPAPPAQTDAPDHSEEVVDRLALAARIAAAWPPGSREHYLLTSLARGVPKAELAGRLGCSTWNITRICRRAWRKVPQ